ncbi:Autophagy protein 22, partial [Podochytrium sp. JEL0797]
MFSGTIGTLIISGIIASVVKVAEPMPANYGFQIGIALSGVLWLIGTGLAYRHLRERPGPEFPAGVSVITYSSKKVYTAIKKSRKLGNLFVFLLGWFMYSDAFNTLTNVAILYAQSVLAFTTTDILIVAAEVPILALVGTFAFNQLQKRTRWSTKRILLIQNALYVLVPAWGVIGLIPGNPVGFKSKSELFLFAGLHGATQSSCRSLFSQLVPPGSESEFFSLYEITDKGSSWIGPLIVAAIDGTTSNKL